MVRLVTSWVTGGQVMVTAFWLVRLAVGAVGAIGAMVVSEDPAMAGEYPPWVLQRSTAATL